MKRREPEDKFPPDHGCDIDHPSCLDCLEPKCLEEIPRMSKRALKIQEKKDRIRSLTAQGKNHREIGEIMGMHRCSIDRLARR